MIKNDYNLRAFFPRRQHCELPGRCSVRDAKDGDVKMERGKEEHTTRDELVKQVSVMVSQKSILIKSLKCSLLNSHFMEFLFK